MRKFRTFGRVSVAVGTITTMTVLVAVGPAWASTAQSSSSIVQNTTVSNSSSLLLPASWAAEAQPYVTEVTYHASLNPTFRSIASPVGYETAPGGPSPHLIINPGGSCNSSLGNVHLSTYYPGNIDSKGSVTCNSPQSQILITVDIYREYANILDFLVATQTRTADNIAVTGNITAFFYCSGTGTYTYYSVAHYSITLDGQQTSWTAITPNETITC